MYDPDPYIQCILHRGTNVYRTITVFDKQHYECGLTAGDRVRLSHDLAIKDDTGRMTGKVHTAGEMWTILKGSKEDPEAVWMRTPDGEMHSWSNDSGIWDIFERVA